MRIESLRIFIRILETGSFTAAAKLEHITQPAVSAAIRSLEDELGKTLFVRSTDRNAKISLTNAGKLFAQYAYKSLEDHHNLRIQIVSQERAIRSISILSTTTPSSTIVPMLITGFHSSYPNNPTHVGTSTKGRIFQQLLDSKCDFCISGAIPNSPEITSISLVYDPVILIAPTSYNLKPIISLRDLKKIPLIIRTPVGNISKRLTKELKAKKIDISQLNIAMEVRANTDVWYVVSQGNGAGFVTESLFKAQPNDNIQKIQIRGFNIHREVYLSYKNTSPLSPEQELFLEYSSCASWRNI